MVKSFLRLPHSPRAVRQHFLYLLDVKTLQVFLINPFRNAQNNNCRDRALCYIFHCPLSFPRTRNAAGGRDHALDSHAFQISQCNLWPVSWRCPANCQDIMPPFYGEAVKIRNLLVVDALGPSMGDCNPVIREFFPSLLRL